MQLILIYVNQSNGWFQFKCQNFSLSFAQCRQKVDTIKRKYFGISLHLHDLAFC